MITLATGGISAVLLSTLIAVGPGALAQRPATKTETAPTPVKQRDAVLDAAAQMVGRALFLRCFCADNTLSFDARGNLQGQAKTTDWTLAGVNVQKVERKGPSEVELDGVRVAIRYAPDRREFERHPQTEDTMHLRIEDTGDIAGFERALAAVFATGIDRTLQLAMPAFWQHYFDPGMVWPQDGLTGQPIQSVTAATATASVAAVTHRSDASYTLSAGHDRVVGTVRLRLVVDAQGMPQRIAIVQPLGYGLDEKSVEAVAKYRFAPARVQGQAVATAVSVNEDFVLVPQ